MPDLQDSLSHQNWTPTFLVLSVNHVVKDGKVRGRQRYLCGSCNRHFFPDAKHPREKGEEALKMYSNGMSMRAISRVLNVPLSTVFKWGVTVGGSMRSWLSCGGRLRRFWRARLLLRLLTRCGLLYKNSRLFTSGFSLASFTQPSGCSSCSRWGDERAFKETLKYLPQGGRWVSDDNVYFTLRNHTM